MPCSTAARQQRVTLPYTEVCMHLGIAGKQAFAYEEDVYANWKPIPIDKRTGCEVLILEPNGVTIKSRHFMLKSEAGWTEDFFPNSCLSCGADWSDYDHEDLDVEPPCYCDLAPAA